jgi:hypothetical protein
MSTSESGQYDRLHFTGRSDILTSYARWRTEWHIAYRADDISVMLHAAEMRDRMARALEERP